jgi:hypothetical protein
LNTYAKEVEEAMSLGNVLLTGDFNVRTSKNTNFIDCSQLVDVLLQPHFGISVRMKLTPPKVGSWSLLGLPKI